MKLTISNSASASPKFDKKVAASLTLRTGITVSDVDYQTWLDGDGEGDLSKFDTAVRKLLGKTVYDKADVAARTALVLLMALGLEHDPEFNSSRAEILLAHRLLTGLN